MKIVTMEQVERLEKISMALERAEQEGKIAKDSKILADMKWMAQELRTAWKKVEDMADHG
jgi:hypothetical protein